MGLCIQGAIALLALGAGVLIWSYIDWRRKRNRFVAAGRVVRMYVADAPSSDCQRNYVP